MKKKIILLIALVIILKVRVGFSQDIQLNLHLLRDTLSQVEPLVLSLELVNNSNSVISAPRFFGCFGRTTIYYKHEKDKAYTLFDDGRGFNEAIENCLIDLKPGESRKAYSHYEFILYNWKNKKFLLEKKGQYLVKIRYQFKIGEKEQVVFSEEKKVFVTDYKGKDKKVLDFILKQDNPTFFIEGCSEEIYCNEVIRISDMMIKKYQYNHFFPYFMRNITSIYRMLAAQNDYIEEASEKNQVISKQAEEHLKKLLDTEGLPSVYKIELQKNIKYHQIQTALLKKNRID